VLFIRSSERAFPTRRRLTPFEPFNGSFYTTSQSVVAPVFWNNIVVFSYPFFVDTVVFVCVRWLHPFEQCAHKSSSTLRNIDYFCSGFYTIHSPSTACTRLCRIRQCRSITIRVRFCLDIFYFSFALLSRLKHRVLRDECDSYCTTIHTYIGTAVDMCVCLMLAYQCNIIESFLENEPLTAIRVTGTKQKRIIAPP